MSDISKYLNGHTYHIDEDSEHKKSFNHLKSNKKDSKISSSFNVENFVQESEIKDFHRKEMTKKSKAKHTNVTSTQTDESTKKFNKNGEIHKFLDGLLVQLNNNNLKPAKTFINSSSSTTPSISPSSTCSKNSYKSLKDVNLKSKFNFRPNSDFLSLSTLLYNKKDLFISALLNQKAMLRKTNQMKLSQSYHFKTENKSFNLDDCEFDTIESKPNGSSQFLPGLLNGNDEVNFSESILSSFRDQLHYSTKSQNNEIIPNENENNNDSEGNSLILSRHGTIRGNVNHVKSSVKQIFKDQRATIPVFNAQLNNTEITAKLRDTSKRNKSIFNLYAVSFQFKFMLD